METPQAALEARLASQQQAFRADPCPSLAVRRERLARLANLSRHHAHAIEAAIRQDFGHRSSVETRLAELTTLQQAIRHSRRRLKRWMRAERVRVDWRFQPARAEIHRQPLGVVGIIAPWNYPWNLAMLPALDALAAGNRVMIKPSEATPTTATLMQQLVADYFADDELCVVTGGVATSRAFAELAFDHLLFTGSTAVGHEVARAAAENLTPITLELGGKSPAIIDESFDLADAARRIAFGKWLNAGQTCIAPDYVLLPEHRVQEFCTVIERAAAKLYPNPANNTDYTAIIDRRHRDRLNALRNDAQRHGCRIVEIGASAEQLEASGKLPPTLIINPHNALGVMREEVFGPLLPIVGVKDFDAALTYVNARPRPLSLYAFSDDPTRQARVLQQTHSGGVVLNDTLWHVAQASLPFGGIGASGYGAYHGKHGFDTFSHPRSVLRQMRGNAIPLIHPPYRRWLLKLLRLI